MAGAIKQNFPRCRIVFLGRDYTREVISACVHIDEFISFDELQSKPVAEQQALIRRINADVIMHVFPRRSIAHLSFISGIPYRVGTRSRFYHWFYCNKLLRLPRKNSQLHEAQLNLLMLKAMQIKAWYSTDEIPALYGLTKLKPLDPRFEKLIDATRINVLLHPLSRGSAAEWGIPNFRKLVSLLNDKKYKIFATGTAEEGERLKGFLTNHPEVVDITGKMDLGQFMSFIARADALVAASTGPLHIASAVGITAIGLYSARRPIFPKRWAPLGIKAHALVYDPFCPSCKKGKPCSCIQQIPAEKVVEIIG